MTMLVLFETAYGYGLFERLESDEIGAASVEAVSAAMQDLGKFGRFVKLRAFVPFKNAAEALENINEVSEGIVSDTLRLFLETNVPSVDGKKKKNQVVLGVSDKTLAGSIKSSLNLDCVSDETVAEVVRGLRLFAHTMLQQHLPTTGASDAAADLERAQLGLGHSYSRAKVKFNVHRSDNMIIQASALLDQLDKDVNTFSMRLREWYSWHFPELANLVADPRAYASIVLILGRKENFLESLHIEDNVSSIMGKLEDALVTISDESTKTVTCKRIIEAAKSSMGTDVSPIDLINIRSFAQRLLALAQYRHQLHSYLHSKMDLVAPNLSALIGEVVGARLISRAGSLTNLSKLPASTVQILGAEKALFRALKTKGKTPKYGLLYHSSFIGRAATKNKGRISRYLSNKCSIASRIDCFSETPTTRYGDALRDQVEERLAFYDSNTGSESAVAPTKNSDVMAKAAAKVAKDIRKSLKMKRSVEDEEQTISVENSSLKNSEQDVVTPSKEKTRKKSRKA